MLFFVIRSSFWLLTGGILRFAFFSAISVMEVEFAIKNSSYNNILKLKMPIEREQLILIYQYQINDYNCQLFSLTLVVKPPKYGPLSRS